MSAKTLETVVTRLKSYLDNLPDGMRSFPSAKTKAGLLHAHQQYAKTPTEELPLALKQLVTDLPPVSIWVPGIYWVALGLTHADAFFPKDDDAYLADERIRAKALMGTSTYKMLQMMTSPAMYVRSAPRRWQTFHCGSQLQVLSAEDAAATLELTFPPTLFPELFLRQVALTFQHMTSHVADQSRVQLQLVREGCARFHFAWTRKAARRRLNS